jgi:hypothetical protein
LFLTPKERAKSFTSVSIDFLSGMKKSQFCVIFLLDDERKAVHTSLLRMQRVVPCRIFGLDQFPGQGTLEGGFCLFGIFIDLIDHPSSF